MSPEAAEAVGDTTSFEEFWRFLLQHPNCILRAGTNDAVLYDDDDLHWHFAAEDTSLFVQVLRGKRLMGEFIVDPQNVSFVQSAAGDREDEYIFELVTDRRNEQVVSYFFVLTHGPDDEPFAHTRAVH